MKRLAKACVALTSAAFLAGAAFADQITVEANKTKPMRLKHAASAIVVGNPNFADVAVHSENLIFITGKTYGTTNLLIFDEAGKQIYSGDIVVTTDASSLVSINRAGSNYTLDCADKCRPVLAVGDEEFLALAQQNDALKELNE